MNEMNLNQELTTSEGKLRAFAAVGHSFKALYSQPGALIKFILCFVAFMVLNLVAIAVVMSLSGMDLMSQLQEMQQVTQNNDGPVIVQTSLVPSIVSFVISVFVVGPIFTVLMGYGGYSIAVREGFSVGRFFSLLGERFFVVLRGTLWLYLIMVVVFAIGFGISFGLSMVFPPLGLIGVVLAALFIIRYFLVAQHLTLGEGTKATKLVSESVQMLNGSKIWFCLGMVLMFVVMWLWMFAGMMGVSFLMAALGGLLGGVALVLLPLGFVLWALVFSIMLLAPVYYGAAYAALRN